jgi:hypothetical protein
VIRTMLASPWLPLLYWLAAVLAVVCGAHRESLKRGLGPHEIQIVERPLAPTNVRSHDASSTPQLYPALEGVSIGRPPARFWYPQIFVFRKPDSAGQEQWAGIGPNKGPVTKGTKTQVNAPISMLSIRFDPPEQSIAKTLAIQCRTSVAINDAQGRIVTIHGVVTQEVVSSVGKILIMAGSRVVGSALLDPENDRFKSNGLWSVFFDNTELKVQAELLDRPSGMLGLLGQEILNENEPRQRGAVTRDGCSIFVPRNAPFVLELHGEILLRDLMSNEASN